MWLNIYFFKVACELIQVWRRKKKHAELPGGEEPPAISRCGADALVDRPNPFTRRRDYSAAAAGEKTVYRGRASSPPPSPPGSGQRSVSGDAREANSDSLLWTKQRRSSLTGATREPHFICADEPRGRGSAGDVTRREEMKNALIGGTAFQSEARRFAHPDV